MDRTTIELIATILFGLAILHTFSVKRFEHLAHKYPEGSVGENTFHLLGEVEVVFGLWAGLLMIGMVALHDSHAMINYLESNFILPGAKEPISVNFTEPVFVFAIMAMAATRPVLQFTQGLIELASKAVPLPKEPSFFIACLVVGPLLGSFITEPAAMTVTALLLKRRFYDKGISTPLMYAAMGVLFVNVSIGGTLTHFAAPPVLMVASKWDWGMGFMLSHFGFKAAIAVAINTVFVAWLFRRELRDLGDLAGDLAEAKTPRPKVPMWLVITHLVLIGLVVMFAHHVPVFMLVFLMFLGITAVSMEHQDELKLKEALLVGAFLMGLVILGGLQKWWLQPLLASLGELPMFLGATGLTAITDNAALTYLGSQVEGLSAAMEYSLVAGAVAGGGLTVIANAPNPAGFGILKSSFGEDGISPIGLLKAALMPTLIAMLCLWFIPSIGGPAPDRAPAGGGGAHGDTPAEVMPAGGGGH